MNVNGLLTAGLVASVLTSLAWMAAFAVLVFSRTELVSL